MDDIITLALAKGRLADMAMDLLEGANVDCSQPRKPGRKLILSDNTGGFRFILVKPGDVPVYVDHGVADIGIVGRDTLLEEGRPLFELLDLKFGACRLCIAGHENAAKSGVSGANLRVATKYPNITRQFYANKGIFPEIIRLNGSVELGPLVGLSDVILDVVESGSTLKANGLTILEEVCRVSARLVVNRVSLKTRGVRIAALIDSIAAQIEAQKEENHA